MAESINSIEEMFYAASQLAGTKREDVQIARLWKFAEIWKFAEMADSPQRVRFLREVLANSDNLDLVRVEATKALCEFKEQMSQEEQQSVGRDLAVVAEAEMDHLVRLWATQQMQWYAEVQEVFDVARKLILDDGIDEDLRVTLLSTIERRGPNPETKQLLSSIDADSALAQPAIRILQEWGQ
jgi:hypothetical protein